MDRLHFSWNARSIAALLALTFLAQETHEMAHTLVGRIVCGCWGTRDFNVWGTCAACAREGVVPLLATLAGPAYSFTLIWWGHMLLRRPVPRAKSFGLALVVGNAPIARVLTPLLGGGDEVLILRTLGVAHGVSWLCALLVVVAAVAPPARAVYALLGNRRRGLLLTILLAGPFFAVGIVVFGALQGLVLRNGILAETGLLGAPRIVNAWLVVVLAAVLWLWRDLGGLLQREPRSNEMRE